MQFDYRQTYTIVATDWSILSSSANELRMQRLRFPSLRVADTTVAASSTIPENILECG